ncbi:MAG: hypothetical protein ACERKV_01140 [Clostridiaceae bacterium]
MENKKKSIEDQCKTLKELNFIYFAGDDYLDAELNYQILLMQLSDFKPCIPRDRYLKIKHSKKMIVEELAASILNQDVVMIVQDMESAKNVIINYFSTKKFVIIEDKYFSCVQSKKIKKLSHKAFKQIEEGKFRNYVFREVR